MSEAAEPESLTLVQIIWDGPRGKSGLPFHFFSPVTIFANEPNQKVGSFSSQKEIRGKYCKIK